MEPAIRGLWGRWSNLLRVPRQQWASGHPASEGGLVLLPRGWHTQKSLSRVPTEAVAKAQLPPWVGRKIHTLNSMGTSRQNAAEGQHVQSPGPEAAALDPALDPALLEARWSEFTSFAINMFLQAYSSHPGNKLPQLPTWRDHGDKIMHVQAFLVTQW